MSEARDNFYSWVSQNQVDDVNSLMDYVSELEQQKAELIEMLQSISGISMGKIKFDIDKLLQKHEGNI